MLDCAVVAHDGAAPVEATVAALRPFLADDVVAAPAAQRLAVVQLVARLVAPSPSDSWVVDVRPLLAEIGRAFVEEQVGVADAPGELPSFAAAASLVAQLRLIHQNGLVEALLEDGADAPEFRDRLPAGLHLATAGHAVAFASDLRIGSNYL